MYIIHIVISQWSVGTDTGMERLSSSNHSLFTKHLSLCKNFSCLSFLASLYLIIFFTSRSRSSVCFWTLRVFKCFTAKSLDFWGGWQDHLVWLTYHFTQSKSCSLLQTPLKYRNNAVVDKIVNSSWGHWGCCVEGTGSSSASTLNTGPWCDLCPQPRCATTASAAPPPSHCASSPSTEGQHWIFLSLQYNFRKEPTPNLLPLDLWEQRHSLSGMDPGWCSKVDLFGWRVFLRRRICCHVADGADPPMSRTRPTHPHVISTRLNSFNDPRFFYRRIEFCWAGCLLCFQLSLLCQHILFATLLHSFQQDYPWIPQKKLNTPTIR